MTGYHTEAGGTLGTPAAFANCMLTGNPSGAVSLSPYNLFPPEPIADAWLNGARATQPSSTVAAVMGPLGPFGVWDRDDYYPGKGPMGPSIPQSQITGWWYMTYETGLQLDLSSP